MKITIQRKISFGVLGLAAVAFVVDRCTTSPAPASAGIALHAAPAAPITTATTQAPARMPEAADSALFSKQLSEAAQARGLDADRCADAFRPSSQFVREAPAREVVDQVAVERRAMADSFRQQHKLLAVMLGGRGGMAMVDGNPVRIGQSIGEFRLTGLDKTSATFETGECRVVLRAAGASTNVAR